MFSFTMWEITNQTLYLRFDTEGGYSVGKAYLVHCKHLM